MAGKRYVSSNAVISVVSSCPLYNDSGFMGRYGKQEKKHNGLSKVDTFLKENY